MFTKFKRRAPGRVGAGAWYGVQMVYRGCNWGKRCAIRNVWEKTSLAGDGLVIVDTMISQYNKGEGVAWWQNVRTGKGTWIFFLPGGKEI